MLYPLVLGIKQHIKMTGIVRCSVSSDHGKKLLFKTVGEVFRKLELLGCIKTKVLRINSYVMRGASARKCKLFALVPLQFKKRYSKLDWLSPGAAHPSMSPR